MLFDFAKFGVRGNQKCRNENTREINLSPQAKLSCREITVQLRLIKKICLYTKLALVHDHDLPQGILYRVHTYLYVCVLSLSYKIGIPTKTVVSTTKNGTSQRENAR